MTQVQAHSERPRVLHLSTVHPANDSRILHRQCRSLAAVDYDVVLAAVHDRAEILDLVRIVPLRRSGSRRTRLLIRPWQALSVAIRERPDIVHFHDPELAPVALALKAFGIRVIYDAHEDLPRQILDKRRIPAVLRAPLARIASRLESTIAARFDLVVVAAPHMVQRFGSSKPLVIRNLPRLEDFDTNRHEHGPFEEVERARGRNIGVYVGALSIARGTGCLVEAVSHCAPEFAAHLLLVGDDSEQIVDTLRRSDGWMRTTYLGRRPPSDIPAILASADIGLVVLQPTSSYVSTLPTKLFEYMAAGLPVIASDFPLWRDIIDRHGCGLLVDPEDPSAVARAWDQLAAQPDEARAMGQRGRHAVEEELTWEREATTLIASYSRLASQLRSRRNAT